MKNKSTILMIVGVWILFIIWELYTTQWILISNSSVLRIDLLIILPTLQFITISTLIKILNNKNHEGN